MRTCRNCGGFAADVVGYALILAIVTLTAVPVLQEIGGRVTELLERVLAAIEAAMDRLPPRPFSIPLTLSLSRGSILQRIG